MYLEKQNAGVYAYIYICIYNKLQLTIFTLTESCNSSERSS